MTDHLEAVELLYKNIGAIPHPEYGVINLMPFSIESDHVNHLKRQVCEGIIGVLADANVLADSGGPPAKPVRNVAVNCRLCSATLLDLAVADSGVANVPAATLIAELSRMDLECPHKPLTADDQRRKIEEAVRVAQGAA